MQNTKGKLYLIPSPLAEDTIQKVLSPQISGVLLETKYFFVENIRTARRLISEFKLGIKIEDLTFFELNKDTPVETTKENIKVILEGNQAGVLSEAGCPAVADPGSILVALAHSLDIQVIPLTGPSSILLALMASGLNGQSFAFHGYLPIAKDERIKSIKFFEKQSSGYQQTQIFIETPYRNNQLLEALVQCCSPKTRLCIAADITGANEMIKTKTIQDWKKELPDLNKIPSLFLFLAI